MFVCSIPASHLDQSETAKAQIAQSLGVFGLIVFLFASKFLNVLEWVRRGQGVLIRDTGEGGMCVCVCVRACVHGVVQNNLRTPYQEWKGIRGCSLKGSHSWKTVYHFCKATSASNVLGMPNQTSSFKILQLPKSSDIRMKIYGPKYEIDGPVIHKYQMIHVRRGEMENELKSENENRKGT